MSMPREKITVIAGGKGKPPGGGGGRGGGRQSFDDWRDLLVRDRDHVAKPTAHNLMLILEQDEELRGLFWLDEFANAIALVRVPPWDGATRTEFTEVDALELAAWIGHPKRYTVSFKVDMILACVEAIARRHKRHPVREYLEGLTWDGKQRLSRLFVDFFDAADSEYNTGCGPCFAVSAVSRILWADPKIPHQGSKVDFMLVLEGEQGVYKTTAVLELFGANWYAESTESPTSKDFFQCLRGRWGVEIGEMSSFSKADNDRIKQIITIRSDVYRASYARAARAFRREGVFVGTTNNDDYLRDASGARRFLPVRVKRADIARIIAERDQIWAEAVHMFRAGFEYWVLPPNAEREQADRYSEDVWTHRVVRWLNGGGGAQILQQLPPERVDEAGGMRVMECSTSEILSYAIGVDAARQDRAAATRVGAIMTRLKWRHYRPTREGERVRYYFRVDDDAPK